MEKVISLMESFLGLGCALGPVLGSVTYEFFGFAWTFLIFGIILSPTSILLFFCLKHPKDLVAKPEILVSDADDAS